MNRILTLTAAVLTSAFLFLPASADVPVQEEVQIVTTVTTTYENGTTVSRVLEEDEEVADDGSILKRTESLAEKANVKLDNKLSPFIWGAELGMCVDLSGMDMSTFNFDLIAGWRNPWVQTLGVSVGVHKSLGTSDTFLPICLVVRSSFRPKPSLFFMDLRLGYSFNTVAKSPLFGDTCASLGCGINLKLSRKFQSYVILSYAFRHFNERHVEMTGVSRSDVSLAMVSFGLSF